MWLCDEPATCPVCDPASPSDSWDRLQETPATLSARDKDGWMDGRMDLTLSPVPHRATWGDKTTIHTHFLDKLAVLLSYLLRSDY